MRTRLVALLVIGSALALSATAQDKPAEKAADKPAADAAKKEPPKPEQSVTQHSIVIGGAPLGYTATAGTLIVRNDKDEPCASIGYVAYSKQDVDRRGEAADHVRLQRRPRLFLGVAAHGRARARAAS